MAKRGCGDRGSRGEAVPVAAAARWGQGGLRRSRERSKMAAGRTGLGRPR